MGIIDVSKKCQLLRGAFRGRHLKMILVCKLYWMVNISSALVQMLFITWDQVSWTLLPRERKLPYLIMMMYRKYRFRWNLKWIRHFMMKGLLHHYQWVEWNNSWNWHVSRELWRLLVEWWSLQICKSAILLHVSTYFCFIEDICCTQFKKKNTNKQKSSTCLVIYYHKCV